MASDHTVVEQHSSDTDLISRLAEFQSPSISKAAWQLINTIVPYVGLWVVMAVMLDRGMPFWTILAPAIVAAGLLVRIFIIFHDCGHDSFLSSRKANRIVGYITGIMTLTPFDDWKHKHAIHHAGSGNLDKRGVGDIWTMTVAEYAAAPPRKQLAYRLYRHPLVLLLAGPVYLFFVSQRFPTPITGPRGRRSVHITNAGIVLVGAVGMLAMGWKNYLMIQLPVMGLASLMGVWMFYVQHQYEDPYWEHHQNWDPVLAAMEGSSYYKLPKVLQWFTGNIGLHHIHHLRARIPNYNLQQCYDSIPALQVVKPLTLLPSLKCIFLNLWDEENRALISFRAARPRLKTFSRASS